MRLLMGSPAHKGQILFWAADECLYPSPQSPLDPPVGIATRDLARNTFALVGIEETADVLVVSVQFPLR